MRVNKCIAVWYTVVVTRVWTLYDLLTARRIRYNNHAATGTTGTVDNPPNLPTVPTDCDTIFVHSMAIAGKKNKIAITESIKYSHLWLLKLENQSTIKSLLNLRLKTFYVVAFSRFRWICCHWWECEKSPAKEQDDWNNDVVLGLYFVFK